MVQWGVRSSAIRDSGEQLHPRRVTGSLGLIV